MVTYLCIHSQLYPCTSVEETRVLKSCIAYRQTELTVLLNHFHYQFNYLHLVSNPVMY